MVELGIREEKQAKGENMTDDIDLGWHTCVRGAFRSCYCPDEYKLKTYVTVLQGTIDE